ncbi:hypothetical protein DPMN_100295 [Dreissena polymorpha]|uniref:Uncharacterized protein n=1 Tax=Dreissena polymorpha TaxID=45954 RepID=A0A9D4R831_DREPO|nr:hypothetical protein DPMN_100295 [Dreissena polymorpha]
MFAQVARDQRLSGFMSYLSNKPSPHSSVNEALKLEDLIELYQHAASRLIQGAAMKMQSLMKNGRFEEEACAAFRWCRQPRLRMSLVDMILAE